MFRIPSPNPTMSAFKFIPFFPGCLCAAFLSVALYPDLGWLGIATGMLTGIFISAIAYWIFGASGATTDKNQSSCFTPTWDALAALLALTSSL